MTSIWIDRRKGGEERKEGRQERNRENNSTVKCICIIIFNVLAHLNLCSEGMKIISSSSGTAGTGVAVWLTMAHYSLL